MFKVRVIPCLDVKDGRVVKGVNFVDLRDAGDPVEAAIAYDAAGADELCFLDITATHENRGIMLDVVRRTVESLVARTPWSTLGEAVHTSRGTSAGRGPARRTTGPRHGRLRRLHHLGPQARRPALRGVVTNPAVCFSNRYMVCQHCGDAVTATRPASTPSNMPRKWFRSAPVKFCSRRWIATAPGRALTSR